MFSVFGAFLIALLDSIPAMSERFLKRAQLDTAKTQAKGPNFDAGNGSLFKKRFGISSIRSAVNTSLVESAGTGVLTLCLQ